MGSDKISGVISPLIWAFDYGYPNYNPTYLNQGWGSKVLMLNDL